MSLSPSGDLLLPLSSMQIYLVVWLLTVWSGNRDCFWLSRRLWGKIFRKIWAFLCLSLCVVEMPASLIQPTSPWIVTPPSRGAGQVEIEAGFEETISSSHGGALLCSWEGGTLPVAEKLGSSPWAPDSQSKAPLLLIYHNFVFLLS